MAKKLQRDYWLLITPAVLALALLVGLRKLGLVPAVPLAEDAVFFIAPCAFVLAVIFAVALPVFYRSLFAHRMRDEKAVPEKDLLKFERTLIHLSLVTPYLVLPAYLLEFPRFYFAGTVLMAFYAGYYFYPSGKRIRFEKRLFRVGDDPAASPQESS